MKHKEVMKLVNDIQSYIFLTTADELSFTTTLKVDEYFHMLRNKLEQDEYARLQRKFIKEGYNSDRIKEGNRKA